MEKDDSNWSVILICDTELSNGNAFYFNHDCFFLSETKFTAQNCILLVLITLITQRILGIFTLFSSWKWICSYFSEGNQTIIVTLNANNALLDLIINMRQCYDIWKLRKTVFCHKMINFLQWQLKFSPSKYFSYTEGLPVAKVEKVFSLQRSDKRLTLLLIDQISSF